VIRDELRTIHCVKPAPFTPDYHALYLYATARALACESLEIPAGVFFWRYEVERYRRQWGAQMGRAS
jgi:hypothetical protein